MSRLNDLFLQLVLRASAGARREEGQGMAEYGLILALVAVLCIAAFTSLKGAIVNTITSVVSAM